MNIDMKNNDVPSCVDHALPVALGPILTEGGDHETWLDPLDRNSREIDLHSMPREQMRQSLGDLFKIAVDALNIQPPWLISSIFGRPWTWIPPYRRYSEFKILDLWRLRRTVKYLVNVTVPSIPRTPPPFGPPLLSSLFWQPTVILQRPDHIGNYTTFPDESWFLINGIMTNDSLAQLNAAYVSYLFHRPITLVQNSTDSFVVDLLQCMLGKEWEHTTEPANKAFPVIYDALKSPHKRRVVVIAHSQGTIIIATVLRLLYALTRSHKHVEIEKYEGASRYEEPEFIYPDQTEIKLSDFAELDPQELAKLEVYCFATCANELKYFFSGQQDMPPTPWIEHFGNEHDIVARLGMQAPRPETLGLHIEGPRYVRRGAWGHFLNAHYLFGIADYQKAGHKKGGIGSPNPYELLNPDASCDWPVPRLFHYINGGVPPQRQLENH